MVRAVHDNSLRTCTAEGSYVAPTLLKPVNDSCRFPPTPAGYGLERLRGSGASCSHPRHLGSAPVEAELLACWPGVKWANTLDDSLARDRAHAALSPNLTERIRHLAQYAECIATQAVLFTRSALGEAIEAARAAQTAVYRAARYPVRKTAQPHPTLL